MAYSDIEDQKRAWRNHYANNKDRYLERNKLRRIEFKNYIDEIKTETPCADCGKVFPPCVMDFHHVDPAKKKFSLGEISKITSMKALSAEIDKCILLCANCHRIKEHDARSGLLV